MKNPRKILLSLAFLLSGNLIAQIYDVDSTISSEDQSIAIEICANGSGTTSLGAFNGDLNGGNYYVTWINFFTSW